MKHVEVLELLEKRDGRIFEDKETFRKALLIDKITDKIVSAIVGTERRFTERSPYEDDKRYNMLAKHKRKKVAEMLDKIDALVEEKFAKKSTQKR